MKQQLIYFYIILYVLIGTTINAQVVYQHINNKNIYEFLDELANDGVISINSVVKPYSRVFIAACLEEANKKKEELTNRQKRETLYFLSQYALEKNNLSTQYIAYKPNDSVKVSIIAPQVQFNGALFRMEAHPILGYNITNNEKGNLTHRWNGASAYAYIGKNVGLYANVRDNSQNRLMIHPSYMVQQTGAAVKSMPKSKDFSEMRGGITYSWNWGSIGLIKDHIAWGDNLNGANIFSGRTPSFAMVKLDLKPTKWFEFNYYHGWLVSAVLDSSSFYMTDYGKVRQVMRPKYIAANMYTLVPWKKFRFSFGNSITYSDLGVHPAYVIPLFFYKSVDHTINTTNNYIGQNSQMFINISSRNIKHLHLFGSIYSDEISFTNMLDSAKSTNFLSFKGGFELSNFPIKNVTIGAELTGTNLMVFQHHVSTTTFESNKYNLGYFLEDNSSNLYLSLTYRPFRGMQLKAEHEKSKKGTEYIYGLYKSARGLPFMEKVIWSQETTSISARYEIMHNLFFTTAYSIKKTEAFDNDPKTAVAIMAKYSPAYFHGLTHSISAGMHVDF